ncbi:pirin family protein [Prosthecochloris sp. SCSIO W1101]|uniref:pirin family protein n=1 Tax=Prosthecochloris sp. SCSIO W1101 TaxID=2992242 RepID=UPI00223D52D0|nr:pirin family protein [Prosthecochloris sp. SCSIO W1101]UZJ42074.1 pirin family protein [Prosthecochloris sp. SCSIO W1101]
MEKSRAIKKVFKSTQVTEGAGVKLKRAFGFSQTPLFDPFLLLDDFRSDNPPDYLKGFPWHPHRGIETITYLLDGSVQHHDSLGNKGVIHPGEVQWMTAGSGIIHEEMPFGNSKGSVAGFQLWANLPASQKMIPPHYRNITKEMIPEIHLQSGVSVRVICGKAEGVIGPVEGIATDPEYLDVTIPAGRTWNHPIQEGYTAFSYIIAGKGYFSHNTEPFSFDTEGVSYFDMETGPLMDNETLVLYRSEGDHVHVSTENSPVRFLMFSGHPLREPIAWHGPIVMNTRKELQTAFQEYNNGTFLKEHQADT